MEEQVVTISGQLPMIKLLTINNLAAGKFPDQVQRMTMDQWRDRPSDELAAEVGRHLDEIGMYVVDSDGEYALVPIKDKVGNPADPNTEGTNPVTTTTPTPTPAAKGKTPVTKGKAPAAKGKTPAVKEKPMAQFLDELVLAPGGINMKDLVARCSAEAARRKTATLSKESFIRAHLKHREMTGGYKVTEVKGIIKMYPPKDKGKGKEPAASVKTAQTQAGKTKTAKTPAAKGKTPVIKGKGPSLKVVKTEPKDVKGAEDSAPKDEPKDEPKDVKAEDSAPKDVDIKADDK